MTFNAVFSFFAVEFMDLNTANCISSLACPSHRLCKFVRRAPSPGKLAVRAGHRCAMPAQDGTECRPSPEINCGRSLSLCPKSTLFRGTVRRLEFGIRESPVFCLLYSVFCLLSLMPINSILISRKRCRLAPSHCVLTFDDGPAGKVTDDLLTVLQEFGVKACFCLVGCQVANRPEQT